MEENRLKFYDDIFKPNTKKKKRRIIEENNELVTKTIKLLKQNKKSSFLAKISKFQAGKC